MATVSNANLVARVASAVLGFFVLGFLCGYFGPIYLLTDIGVAPLTGYVAAPVGALVGGSTAVHSSQIGLSGSRYFFRLLAAAALFAGAVLLLVVMQ